MKRGDLIRHLKCHGCEFDREGKNHELWRRSDMIGPRVAVPRHNEELDTGLVAGICRQLGIPKPKFR